MSMLPRLIFKVRMMARMFGKTREIPKTMTINRTMRRGNQDIYLPRKKALSSFCCLIFCRVIDICLPDDIG